MSHLTSSPFHKPYPYDFPRPSQLPTPPDTEPEFTGFTHPQGIVPAATTEADPLSLQTNLAHDAHVSRMRRVSTLSYRNTGLRDNRERSSSGQTKWLIVVVPPPSLSKAHGNLGHTLASGPPDRLPQGTLMPLFPTMYGQLTVIAREFNFPSTTGLCLYLHMAENGLAASPRISDETWPMLWGHLFDARSPSLQLQQLPVCGRVEFDIDFHKARWYDAWVASSRRYAMDFPVSAAPSTSHWRGDSKTTFQEDQLTEEQSEPVFMPPSRNQTPSRHVPRKLSLLDRFDAASLASNQANQTARNDDFIETPRPLAPIMQEEEPKTATKDLESRVKTWRASSSVAPTLLGATGQISLDPVHMPNDIVLKDSPLPVEEGEEALNLDDFTWSVSSPGPTDYDNLESPLSWDRVPSVHLDRRLEGSVLLSPSTATSFGPDDDLVSLVSYASRYPSPDIGLRMLDDAPPTPSTATSWGAPLEYPASPLSVSRPPSVDLAHRMTLSRSTTPVTATSWGPSSWPASPASLDRVSQAPSLDLGERGGWSRPATPSTATSWGPPLSYPPSPFVPNHIRTPDAGQRAFDSATMRVPNSFEFIFPYFRPDQDPTWQHVWPYTETSQEPVLRDVPPSIIIQSPEVSDLRAVMEIEQQPFTAHVPKNARLAFTEAPAENRHSVQLSTAYPTLNIYPAAYPNFEIYPGHACSADIIEPMTVRLPAMYPAIDVYRAAYPNFEIYPGHVCGVEVVFDLSMSVHLPAVYPSLDIYPAVYPYMSIYPTVIRPVEITTTVQHTTIRGHYPNLDIYPEGQRFDDTMYHRIQPVHLPSLYPALVIYPAMYLALDIYPAVAQVMPSAKEIITSQPTPSSHRQPVPRSSGIVQGLPVRLPVTYPSFDLYPPAYPVFDLYPATPSRTDYESSKSISNRLDAQYPMLNIYPAVYPHFNIYPSPEAEVQSPDYGVNIALDARYPILKLYPATYPYFEIYPGEVTDLSIMELPIITTLTPSYPCFDIYPSVYPYFDIYRSGWGSKLEDQQDVISVKLPACYPALRIYSPVYPHFELWPSVAAPAIAPSILGGTQRSRTHVGIHQEISGPSRRKWSGSHSELHDEAFKEASPPSASYTPPPQQDAHSTVLKAEASLEPHRGTSSQIDQETATDSVKSRSRLPLSSQRVAMTNTSVDIPYDIQLAPLPPKKPVPASLPPPTPPLRPLPNTPSPSVDILGPMPRLIGLSSSQLRRMSSVILPPSITLSPVEENPSASTVLYRSRSLATQPIQEGSDTQRSTRSARRRDSLVLEKARMFDTSPVVEDPPTRITMNTLAEFPLPPRPPVPANANGTTRPVSKLDRTKYPFM